MYDLIYANKEVEDIIKDKYPEADIKDTSDYIHTDRFECVIGDIEEDEFYIFAIQNGFAFSCLGFNFMMHNCPEGSQQSVFDWIAEAQALKESEVEINGK